MFGLDDWIAGLGHGASPLVVLGVALLLGLRHASDPDHLVAVSSLVATDQRAGRRAARLGLAWGTGHATTLVALGVPIVFAGRYLPAGVRRGAEALVGIVIVALAVQLLRKWRRGGFHVHEHEHERDGVVHRHLHHHGTSARHAHGHPTPRTSAQSFAVGLVHGIGGSAGAGLLLLVSIHDRMQALAALLLFACATAVSMAILSLGAGFVLARAPAANFVPGLGALALGFGVWYALGAVVQ